jgi:hypothetical protein
MRSEVSSIACNYDLPVYLIITYDIITGIWDVSSIACDYDLPVYLTITYGVITGIWDQRYLV